MSGSVHPIRVCDHDCALVNNCQCGGVKCDTCGLYFCRTEIDENGECPDCASKREDENEDGEEVDRG